MNLVKRFGAKEVLIFDYWGNFIVVSENRFHSLCIPGWPGTHRVGWLETQSSTSLYLETAGIKSICYNVQHTKVTFTHSNF